MKNALLLVLVAGLFAFIGCDSDRTDSPVAPADTSTESQFPVNPDMPGVETEFSLTKEATGDIVDTAFAKGFHTLVAAVQAAELEDDLRGGGPFTVFAPTEDAFANLPDGLLDALRLPENQSPTTRRPASSSPKSLPQWYKARRSRKSAGARAADPSLPRDR